LALYIPDEKLAEIRNAGDIVDVISARVFLKNAGKDYSGLCPFHAEKTPSFTVSPEKQIFHCFGCGVGGDVFTFLMKYEGISFPEAVEAVARQWGIVLPAPDMSDRQRQQASEREQLLGLNRRVMAFYHNLLLKDARGKPARDYLEKRGMNAKMIEQFNIGFAPQGWDNLTGFLRKNRQSLALAEKAGLIVAKKQNKGFYDRFRNRVIFPILDVTGQVVAFGGRVMDDALPKYLNSPETPVYQKRRTLYGMHAARAACRSRGCVYIVEGYFDLLAMHQHGLTNSVASLGTSLTRDHIRRLSRAAGSGDKKAYLVFDSDAAGINAAKRTIGAFLEESMEASVILLPSGHDPDSFLFDQGPEAFDRLAGQAPGLFGFLIDNAVSTHGLSIEGKVKIVAQIAPVLAEIRDAVARSVYIQHLAETIGVDEQAVLGKVRQYQANASDRLKNARQPNPVQAADGRTDSSQKDFQPADRLEMQVVAMMIRFPEMIAEVEKKQILAQFEDGRMRELGRQVCRIMGRENGTASDLLHHLRDEQQRQMVASVIMEEACWAKQSCSLLLSQFIHCRQRRKNDLLQQIRAAEQNNDHELLLKLLSEKQKQAAGRH
jgi:DNA primase